MLKARRRVLATSLLGPVLLFVCCLARSMGLSGNLDGFLELKDPLSVSDFRLVLGSDLDAGCFDAALRAVWDLDSFEEIDVRSQIALGDWRIRMRVQCSPKETETFDAARFDLRGSLGGLSFGNLLALYRDENDSYDEVTFRGTVEDVAVDVRVRASICPAIAFDNTVFRANWVGLPCRVPMDVRLRFDGDIGFDSLTFRMRDIPLPVPWGDRVTLTGRLWIEFEEGSKRVLPSLDMLVEPLCLDFTPFIALGTGDNGWSLETVDLEGYELIAELGDAVLLTLATSFVDDADRRIVGESGFFEKAALSGPIAGCCGEEGDWAVAIYFLRDPEQPTAFGWGRFAASANLPFGNSFEVGFETVFDAPPADPSWQLRLRLSCTY